MHRLGGDDPQRLGPYRLKAVVGDGGMGRVYLGTSPGGRAVAVKVIGRGLTERPGYRERFAREARAAMAVSGLYTASVVDADTASESPYIATEFVPAPSLAEAVAAAGPLPSSAVVALAGGMAEALAAIHRAGLVHRDVKPHNILLAADGPVVIDFGIAVGDEASLTATGVMVGTPGYLAPEVLRGADPSARSDVFALGCVLVYAARGIGPFGRGPAHVIAQRAALGEPDLSGLPDPVRTLVTPMLHKDPDRRPTPEQLLQHVSLSSSAILLDGTWLPEGIRALLEQRRVEVQWALNDGFAKADSFDPSAGVPAPDARPGSEPGTAEPPHRAPTPAQDFSVLHGGPALPPPSPPPAARGSQKTFIASVAVGGVVVLVGAVVAVLMLSNGGGSGAPPAAASGNTTAGTRNLAGAGSPTSPTSPDDPSSDPAPSQAEGVSGTGVADYEPGIYPVGKALATDVHDDTITLTSITVNDDGGVSAQLTYTDAHPGLWTCAAAQPGEAGIAIGSGTPDPSTGSDCTKDPDKTWYMTAGQTTVLSEYFAAPPAGSGTWTFDFDSLTVQGEPDFEGEVSGIAIRTH